MEDGNEGKNLAQDMKKEEIAEQSNTKENQEVTEKYYINIKELELNRIKLQNVNLVEKTTEETNENGQTENVVTYDIYMKLKDGVYANVATINEEGRIIPNEDILDDDRFNDADKEKLGAVINQLKVEQQVKVKLDKLQEQLEGIEAKTKEEIEQEMEGKDRDDSIKDRDETDKEREEEKDDKEEENDLREVEEEAEQKVIAKRKHIDEKNVCKIRRDSQFFKNYPNIPKTAYFYLDENDRMQAEYIDKDGQIQELSGFNEIKDKTKVTSFGKDGQDVKENTPYRVMSAEGLEDKNKNTQDVRIAIYKDNYGYLRIETIHQGRNGQWEGKNIDTYGRDRNTTRMNRMIDEKDRTPTTGKIAKRQEELKRSGFSQDGLSLDEFSKQRKITEYVRDGYTLEEANSIYDYVVGDLQLTEDKAKEKVNEEKSKANAEKEPRQAGGRDMGEEAYDRLFNHH